MVYRLVFLTTAGIKISSMRLLHVKELRFEEFFDSDIPRYAILSHRWGKDEVSYQDFLAGRKKDSEGYKKILACCEYVMHHVRDEESEEEEEEEEEGPSSSVDWVWIDTCCIDKSSSAELTESINSMYRWYEKAVICYAYLKDVNGAEERNVTLNRLRKSEWFSRGWTLQELLAPEELIFLDAEWIEIGDRQSLSHIISQTTGIHQNYMISHFMPEIPVAVKMSWASGRVTSRMEDRAYSLLGIFDINMPLIYGEGEKAFQRLLLEILRNTDDESIFAWDTPSSLNSGKYLLPLTPDGYGKQVAKDGGEFFGILGVHRPPYTVTNKGLEMRVPAALINSNWVLLPLNCQHVSENGMRRAYAVVLQRSTYRDEWFRIRHSHPGNIGVVHISETLYSVSRDLVWSRADLDKQKSEIIYVQLFDRF